VDLISDLHLQASQPATTAALLRYLQQGGFDALFVLGDLFEVWIGDDVLAEAQPNTLPNAEQQTIGLVVQALRQAAAHARLYIMRGNRDFLLDDAFATATACTLLSDPCVLDWGQHRWLLSHGDAWCLTDTSYLQFRQTVRQPDWQSRFLAQPLAQRAALASQLREKSEQHKRNPLANGDAYADVDDALAAQWLRQTQCQRLIHGHTHRPGRHPLGDGLERVVLSDWDANAQPPRLEVLSLHSDGNLMRWPLNQP